MSVAENDFSLDGVAELTNTPIGSTWMRPIEALGTVLLVAIIGLLLAGVVTRYVLAIPVVWIDEAASIAFLWMAMLGAAVAIDRSEHLRLTAFLKLFPNRLQAFISTQATIIVITTLAALTIPAVEYVLDQSRLNSPTLGIPLGYRASGIVIGIVLMLVCAFVRLVQTSRSAHIAIAVSIVVALGGIGWALSPVFADLRYANILIFLVGVTSFCLVLGVPIAFCFGLAAISFLVFSTDIPLIVTVGRIDEGMSGVILLSVPIFVLLGCILDATGMGKAIVDFMVSLLGHVKAGMAYVLLGSLFLVSGISGSKVSDMATIAPPLFPEMKRRGYAPKEMIALLATGAAMADTVPPSIVLIVLGSVAGISIAALFTSGVAIAAVLLVALAVVARWKARGENMQGIRRASLHHIGRTALIATPVLLLPFLIRGAVGGGIATATEVSTLAVLYAFIVGVVLYGGIPLPRCYGMLVETVALSGAILLILGTAAAMAWSLTQTGFAFQLAKYMSSAPGGWLIFMLVSIAVYLVLGCVLEGLPAIVLMAPIMFPVAKQLGIHEVHYAMVMVTSMNIGLMAPPIGIGFYIACKIGNVSPDEAMGAIWVYLGALVVGLLLIAAVPALSIAYL